MIDQTMYSTTKRLVLIALLASTFALNVFAQDAPKTAEPKQPDEVQLAMNNGRLTLAQGRIDEAELYNVLGVVLYLQNEKKSYEEAVEALQRSIELSKGKVVKAYYNLGFALIKSGKEEQGVAALKTYLQLEPNGNEAAQARAVVANTKMVDARVAPTFAFKSNTGEELSMEKLRGKIVLLEFWASWCGPCRAELPEVNKIWKKYGGDQFIILGINLDSNRQV